MRIVTRGRVEQVGKTALTHRSQADCPCRKASWPNSACSHRGEISDLMPGMTLSYVVAMGWKVRYTHM